MIFRPNKHFRSFSNKQNLEKNKKMMDELGFLRPFQLYFSHFKILEG